MKKTMFGVLTALLSLMTATAGAEVSVHDPSVIKADGT